MNELLSHEEQTREDQAMTVSDVASGLSVPRRELAYVFARDYVRGIRFLVISRLPPATTITVLTERDGTVAPLIRQPDDYFGYVVTYYLGGSVRYSMVFTKALLEVSISYRLVGDVTYVGTDKVFLGTPFESTRD